MFCSIYTHPAKSHHLLCAHTQDIQHQGENHKFAKADGVTGSWVFILKRPSELPEHLLSISPRPFKGSFQTSSTLHKPWNPPLLPFPSPPSENGLTSCFAGMASIFCSTPPAPLLPCPFPSLLACLGLHPLLTSQACACPHALKLLYHPPLRHHLNVPRLPSWEKHPASNLQSALIIILFFTAKLLEMSLPSSLPSANSGLPPRTSGKTHTSLVLAAKLHQHISDRPPLFLSPLPSPTHTPACPCIWRTHLFPLPPSLLFKL